MDHQLDAGLVGNGTDFAEEIYQVGAQLFGGDILIAVKLFLELLQGKEASLHQYRHNDLMLAEIVLP